MAFAFRSYIKTFTLILLFQSSFNLQAEQLSCSKAIQELRPDLFAALQRVLDLAENSPRKELTIDLAIESQVVAWVQRTSRFWLSGQALDFFNAQVLNEQDIVSETVQKAIQKQKQDTGSSMFFRFLGPQHSGDQILQLLREKIIKKDYTLREASLASGQQRPQLFGETQIELNGEKIKFRFGILLPNTETKDPVLTLMAPQIDGEMNSSLLAAYRDPRIPDWLVLSDWVNGKPQKAAVVPYQPESIIRSVADIDDDFFDYYYRTVSERSGRSSRTPHFDEARAAEAKRIIVAGLKSQEPALSINASSYLRSPHDLSVYEYERAVALKARNFLLKKTEDPSSSAIASVFYFPHRFSTFQIKKIFMDAIKAENFSVYRSQKVGTTTRFSGETVLEIEGVRYPVSFIISRSDSAGAFMIESIHALYRPNMSNDIVEVFYDDSVERFVVASAFNDGLPRQAVLFDINGNVLQ